MAIRPKQSSHCSLGAWQASTPFGEIPLQLVSALESKGLALEVLSLIGAYSLLIASSSLTAQKPFELQAL